MQSATVERVLPMTAVVMGGAKDRKRLLFVRLHAESLSLAAGGEAIGGDD